MIILFNVSGQVGMKGCNMQKKQVAVLDIGSSELRAYIGERGVNKTFIIKGTQTFSYEGFSDREFFDVEELKKKLLSAGNFFKKASRTGVVLYVGVPGDFTDVQVRLGQISFPKKKKITEQDVDSLYDSTFMLNSAKKSIINRSAIVYELDDSRRLANPVGAVSEILKGKLSFVLCDNYFIDIIKKSLNACGINQIEFVSTSLAQAMYLVDAEVRDRIAVIADVGYISTTISVVHGDGILFQKSFGYGGGYITASLSESFNISFDDAENLKRKSSITRVNLANQIEILDDASGKYYNLEEVKKCICYALDGFCDEVTNCLDGLGFVLPDYVHLMITGGGISLLRGAKEYIASRLGMAVEIISPKVPLLDSPLESSALSLMDLALEQ